jgi:hypothetical protein
VKFLTTPKNVAAQSRTFYFFSSTEKTKPQKREKGESKRDAEEVVDHMMDE